MKKDNNKRSNFPNIRFSEFSGEWEVKRLGECARIYDGTHQTPKYVETGIPFYSVEQITSNNFEKTKFISEEVFNKEIKRVRIEKEDILMTRIGDIGTSKYIDWNVNASFYVSVALIKSKERINSEFLHHFISTIFFQKELWKKTIHVAFPKKINLGEIGECKILFPKLKEQTKIANFLSKLDERIEIQRTTINKLETLIKGYRQKLFSQELRFKDENGESFPDWEKKTLGEVLTKNSKKNKELKYSVVESVSNKYGFINQEDVFKDRRVASANTSNYYIIKKGCFAYNPSRINVGSLAYKYDDKVTLISPLYISFYANNNLINDIFILKWFFSNSFIYQMNRAFEGGVRNTLSYENLQFIIIKIPCLDEQSKIASFLSKLDDKLNVEKELLTQLEKQKKFFLQNMFV